MTSPMFVAAKATLTCTPTSTDCPTKYGKYFSDLMVAIGSEPMDPSLLSILGFSSKCYEIKATTDFANGTASQTETLGKLTSYGFPTTTAAAPIYMCDVESALSEGTFSLGSALTLNPSPSLTLGASPDFTINLNSYNLKFTAQSPPAGAKMVQATVSAVILAAFTTLY